MFNTFFYHRLIRKYIILFGSVFDNITVKRMNSGFTAEIERIKVPVNWAAKEKYIQRINNSTETPKVQTVLPRMSFELLGLNYDPDRKQQNMQRYATLNTSNNSVVWASYMAAPYDFDFRLNIHARNIEDMAQIIEQILPYFQPDYTPTVNLVDNLDIPKDVKIILRNIQPNFFFEGELSAGTRDVICALTFTLKGYFFGPVSSDKVITKVIANVYDDIEYTQVFNLGNGSGTFADDDVVYQGNNQNFATASGHLFRQYIGANVQQIWVDNITGSFSRNVVIKSASTNASYILSSFDGNNVPIATFTVTPNPVSANSESNFGIDISIDDWIG